MSDLANFNSHMKRTLGGETKPHEEVDQRIEDLFTQIEMQTRELSERNYQQALASGKDPSASSHVAESIKRSMFGVFTQNFNRHKGPKMDFWRDMFADS